MAHPSNNVHSDDIDDSRDRQLLPSFAKAFPASPTISRSQLRNTPSDPLMHAPPSDSQKRKRDDDGLSIKNEDSELDRLPDEPPPAPAPNKRPRSKINSSSLSPPQLPPPITSKPSLPRSKHTLAGHAAALLNDSLSIASSSKAPAQTLPSTGSFSGRRAAMSTSNSRKGAPSSLSINPLAQSSRKAKELGLEPVIRSAPPVPASRLRLHQVQSMPQSHAFHQATGGGVPVISKVRFGATYETSSHPARMPQPPKTAGLMGSSSHISGGSGIQTVLQPPTPSTAGGQSSRKEQNPIPLVPPTPSSLRHALNQVAPPRQPQTNISAPAITEGRPATHALPSTAKQAFLQPFEAFYESLADARALKDWLGDTLNRANALVQQQQQQAPSSPSTRMIEEIVDNRMRGHHAEIEQLRERVLLLEDALARNGIVIPSGATVLGMTPTVPSNSLSRPNGSSHRSPGNKRDRELPILSNLVGNVRDPHSQHLRPASLSPSIGQTVLPPPSSLTKMSTSSSRLDPLPSRTQLPSVARSPRVPSPLGGSPISEGEERRESRETNKIRRSHEDKEDRMDTT